MSLVLAAIVPHPPIILQSIGREHTRLLERTIDSYAKISSALTEAKPDTILVISPHLSVLPETFTINHAPEYSTHFLDFGDFSPPRKFVSDPILIERIRHEARKNKKQIITVSEDCLDYGSGVPLKLIPSPDINPAIAIISPTTEAAKNQFDFGRVIKEAIMGTNRRVAVLCSADLSHRLSSDAPNGFSPRAKDFDDLMVKNLTSGGASSILQMDAGLIEEAHACGYRSICLFLGIIDRINCAPENLSYEAPFGVGYLTMNFHLK